MKLVNREKFHLARDVYEFDKPDRVYNCFYNNCRKNVFEWLWLYPESNLIFGKHHMANIWWFLLILFCPFITQIYDIFKYGKIETITLLESIIVVLLITSTLCGLGPLLSVVVAYSCVRKYRKIDNK